MRVYYVFGFLWVIQFVMACQSVIIAGAVGTWYFRRDKSKLGTPILTSMGNLIRYHLGSVAFGALIIAIVQMIRLVLKYIEQKSSGMNEGLKWCLRCCQCCLWCFEKFLKFLNRNAYIQIALFGYSFCKGARNGFAIVAKNALRVGTLNFVGEFVFFLVK
ncbi:Choline transporter-like protein 1, partial [Armadillidium nasatum]